MVTYSTLDWTPLKFGKHEGKTLPQIVLNDPDWFFLGVDLCALPWTTRFWGALDRMQSTKHNNTETRSRKLAGWILLLADDKFSGFSIVKAEIAGIESGKCQISSHLDLSYPWQSRPYDKLGNKMMLKSFKHYYFGGSSLTKEKCENFFYRSKNFIWRKDEKVIPDSNAG